jgi:DNA-directed RNA polymerase subunit RPC12/RpoP
MSYRMATAKDWLKTGLYILVTLAVIILASILLPSIGLVGIVLWAVIFVGGMYLLVRWHANSTAYRCSGCDHEFEISTLADLISPHIPNKKYLKCPQCGKRNWATILMRVNS